MARNDLRFLDGPFSGAAAVDAGYLTSKQLRGPAVRRVFRGVYVMAGVPVDHEVRARAATLLLPDSAALSGRSAAAVHGVSVAGTADPTEITVPEADRFGPVSGMVVHRSGIATTDSVPWADARVTTPVRTAFDLARSRHPATALGDVDAFLRATALPLADVREYLAGRRNHGVVQARAVLARVDQRAESRPESAVRWHLLEAGLCPVPQFEIRLRGGALVRVDLAFPAERVAVEYDGGWHALREQLSRDRTRMNALRESGWYVVHVTADSLARGPAFLVREVEHALVMARRAA